MWHDKYLTHPLTVRIILRGCPLLRSCRSWTCCFTTLTPTVVLTARDTVTRLRTPESSFFSALHVKVSITLAVTEVRKATFSRKNAISHFGTDYITIRPSFSRSGGDGSSCCGGNTSCNGGGGGGG